MFLISRRKGALICDRFSLGFPDETYFQKVSPVCVHKLDMRKRASCSAEHQTLDPGFAVQVGDSITYYHSTLFVTCSG